MRTSFQAEVEDLLNKGLVWRGAPSSDALIWQRAHYESQVIPFGSPEIDNALPSGGLPCGASHELYYHDPHGIISFCSLLPVALTHSAIKQHHAAPSSGWETRDKGSRPYLVVWIGKRSWPAPFSLNQSHIENYLFIDPPNQKLLLWSIEAALRSSIVKVVVADCPRISLAISRRFALLARTNSITALFLRDFEELKVPSAAWSKWTISPTPSSHGIPLWKLTLERLKGGGAEISSWIVGLESRYDEGTEVSLLVFPALVDGRDEEKASERRFAS